LLDRLLDVGRALGCAQLHLDSGVPPERFDAHRLYDNTVRGSIRTTLRVAAERRWTAFRACAVQSWVPDRPCADA
jgi:hypothetical protein